MVLFLWFALILSFNGSSIGIFAQTIIKCGLDPDTKRVVILGARGALEHENPIFDLLRVDVEDQHTVLCAISNEPGKERKFYRSFDRGLTWLPYHSALGDFTNLPRTHEIGTLRLAGTGLVRIAYELDGCEGRSSKDGGKLGKPTWPLKGMNMHF